jgi:hypothetical protein
LPLTGCIRFGKEWKWVPLDPGGQGAGQHGEDSSIRAAEPADELWGDGDVEGAAIWRAIMAAIEELQRGRQDGEAVN